MKIFNSSDMTTGYSSDMTTGVEMVNSSDMTTGGSFGCRHINTIVCKSWCRHINTMVSSYQTMYNNNILLYIIWFIDWFIIWFIILWIERLLSLTIINLLTKIRKFIREKIWGIK